jgi:hypothetical protein
MNILCKGVVEIRNKFIPNYFTNNPNEEKMTDYFALFPDATRLMQNSKSAWSKVRTPSIFYAYK